MANYAMLSKRAKETALFKKEIIRRGLSDFYNMCCVCAWNEAPVDLCHVYSFENGGSCSLDNMVPLCPNHHRVFDRGLANEIHMEAIHGFLCRIAQKLEGF